MAIKHEYEWYFEKNEDLHQLARVNATVKKFYGAVESRPRNLSGVDMLAAGFPCQPFSQGGSGEGVRDKLKRGTVIFEIKELITELPEKPRLLLLENVSGMYFRHKELLAQIVSEIEALGYYPQVWMLSSLDCGVPHHRIRLWITGILKTCLVKFPSPPKPLKHLPKLTDGFLRLEATVETRRLTERERKLVDRVVQDQAASSCEHPILIDIESSETFGNFSVGRVMCLTKARAEAGGYYIVQRKSMLTTSEMALLMGLSTEAIETMEGTGIEEKTLRGALGNAQAINVLERVLGHPTQRAVDVDVVLVLCAMEAVAAIALRQSILVGI